MYCALECVCICVTTISFTFKKTFEEVFWGGKKRYEDIGGCDMCDRSHNDFYIILLLLC